MEALTASVRVRGILQHFLWRPHPAGGDLLEIIFGARRYRAAKGAGLKEVPGRLIEVDDRTALEMMTAENDQRKDVDLMEQAEGYANFVLFGHTPESLAGKIGRSVKYIYNRLELLKLAPSLQDDLRAGKLPFDHAKALCRLQTADQEWLLSDRCPRPLYDGGRVCLLSALKDSIGERFLEDLSPAESPWMRDDSPTLVPSAGSCKSCPKRTGSNPTLFDVLYEDDEQGPPLKRGRNLCTDRACYSRKLDAFVELGIRTTTESTGREPLKISAEYSARRHGVISASKYEIVDSKTARDASKLRPAVIVEGQGTGRTVSVRLFDEPAAAKVPAVDPEESERKNMADAKKRAAEIALDRAMTNTTISFQADPLPSIAAAKLIRHLVAAIIKDWVGQAEIQTVCKRRCKRREIAVKDGDHRSALVDLAFDSEYEPGDLLALLVELAAARKSFAAVNDFSPAEMTKADREWWKAFGVDWGALAKEALSAKGEAK
jgi:ParB/RepB/Spo0J family partition protein